MNIMYNDFCFCMFDVKFFFVKIFSGETFHRLPREVLQQREYTAKRTISGQG